MKINSTMMYFKRTHRFKKSYRKLDKQAQKVINQTMIMLAEDAFHPSLRVKKMKSDHNPDVWEASADMELRITLELKLNTIVLRNCGHHDHTLNNP